MRRPLLALLKRLLILPPVLGGALLLAWAMGTREAPERAAAGERATPVAVISVAPRAIVPRVTGFGSVNPARTWRAVPQVSGRVVEIHPELTYGGSVGEGELLLRIAPETYKAAIAQAEARIAAAEAEIRQLEVEEETTRASLGIERDALSLAERELERQRTLVERGTVPQSRVDEQRRAVLEQRARVQDLENRLATLPARRDAARQEKRVSEADREMAGLDLDRTEIRAPFDARVASADVQILQFVATGAEIAVLDGVGRAEIAAQIPPSRMAGFVRLTADGRFDGAPQRFSAVGERLELSATVRLAGGAGRRSWQADVARISDTVDPETRSVGVVVTVEDPYGRILPGERPPLIKGMFTRVELTAPAVADRLVVPRSAVRDGRVMVVDEDSRLAFAPVEVVYTQGDVAVLAGGLSPGTRVVVSDPTPAIEGMLLSPSPAEDTAARIAADIAAPAEGR